LLGCRTNFFIRQVGTPCRGVRASRRDAPTTRRILSCTPLLLGSRFLSNNRKPLQASVLQLNAIKYGVLDIIIYSTVYCAALPGCGVKVEHGGVEMIARPGRPSLSMVPARGQKNRYRGVQRRTICLAQRSHRQSAGTLEYAPPNAATDRTIRAGKPAQSAPSQAPLTKEVGP